MAQKSDPTHAALRLEIRTYVDSHPDDDLDSLLAYWRHMHRWGWCGAGVTLTEVEQMVRDAKGGA